MTRRARLPFLVKLRIQNELGKALAAGIDITDSRERAEIISKLLRTCPQCQGSRVDSKATPESLCRKCGGEGEVWWYQGGRAR
jgi:hypothetical protein